MILFSVVSLFPFVVLDEFSHELLFGACVTEKTSLEFISKFFLSMLRAFLSSENNRSLVVVVDPA